MIPWHHLFGRILDDLCTGTSYQVEVEKDLSVKQQLLDVAVIEVRDDGPFVGLDDPPDGLDDLKRYNLITFKSFRDTLSPWPMAELLGHFVTYRKQCSPDLDDLVSLSEFRLIAVTARFPQTLASQPMSTTWCKALKLVRLRSGNPSRGARTSCHGAPERLVGSFQRQAGALWRVSAATGGSARTPAQPSFQGALRNRLRHVLERHPTPFGLQDAAEAQEFGALRDHLNGAMFPHPESGAVPLLEAERAFTRVRRRTRRSGRASTH